MQQLGNKAAIIPFRNLLLFCKKAHPILQAQLQQITDSLPPPTALDALYEEVIEWNKRAATKATIENKRAYQERLKAFLNQFNSESKTIQAAWNKAAQQCQNELEQSAASIKNAKQVKERIDQLEEQEKAKIYCIIKGKDKSGQTWGRIDYVGAAYVLAHQNNSSGSNDLPLEVYYYSYTNGHYQLDNKSDQLKTAFDKQLMDAFQKSGLTSYEQYKNLGRDYEYTPDKAPIAGKGAWYLRLESPNPAERVAREIEVPDWEDFGFEKIYAYYLDRCEKGILLPKERAALKQQLQEQLAQQKARLQELEQFHHQENDSAQNTAELISIWQQRIGQYQEAFDNLKEDCYRPTPAVPSIELGKPLAIDLGGYIIPDENSDYWDYSRKKWVSGAEEALATVVNTLNENKNFITTIVIHIEYSCGDPTGITGNDCLNRSKALYKNTILRLKEFGLEIHPENIKKGKLNAYQDPDASFTGAKIKIIVK